MKAEIITYGGDTVRGLSRTYKTVQHWQLFIDDIFIADTSAPEHVELYRKIVEVINARDKRRN